MKAIKAAAVQAASVYLNLDASITKAGDIVAEAAHNEGGSRTFCRRHRAAPTSRYPPANHDMSCPV